VVPAFFHAKQGRAGTGEQSVEIQSVARVNSAADRNFHAKRPLSRRPVIGQKRRQAIVELRGLGLRIAAVHENQEFIETEPRHRGASGCGAQQPREIAQERFRHRMAVDILDVAEPPEIEREQRELLAAPGIAGDEAVHPAAHRSAIAQSRQRIMVGQIGNSALRPLSIRDIDDHVDRSDHLAIGVENRRGKRNDRHADAIGPLDDGLDAAHRTLGLQGNGHGALVDGKRAAVLGVQPPRTAPTFAATDRLASPKLGCRGIEIQQRARRIGQIDRRRQKVENLRAVVTGKTADRQSRVGEKLGKVGHHPVRARNDLQLHDPAPEPPGRTFHGLRWHDARCVVPD
jgi:hypothetical protein